MPLAAEVLVHLPKQIAKPSKFVCSELCLYEALEPSGDHREVHRQHVPIGEAISVWEKASLDFERQGRPAPENDSVFSQGARQTSRAPRAISSRTIRARLPALRRLLSVREDPRCTAQRSAESRTRR